MRMEARTRCSRALRRSASSTRWERSAGLVLCLLAVLVAGPFARPARAQATWTTYHRDAGRSGADPDAVDPVEPVEAWQSTDLGAPIWGQPLILGSRVYVATTGDLLYALAAQTGEVVWKRRLGIPVPFAQLPCGDITPTVGVVGTPVIDPASGTIYAVADTWNRTTAEVHHVLKGFSSSGRAVLTTTVDPPGSDPRALLQRTALNLDNGSVVFGFGGNRGDCGDYRGAVVSAPESGGSPIFWQYQPAAPATGGGAVWAPSGPAVDSAGRIYASTGNPNTPSGLSAETYDYSDSLVELDGALRQIGGFAPPSWLFDSNHDVDLGSSGPELLPGGLIFQAGKNGTGYLIDEVGLGEGAPPVFSHQVCAGQGSFGGDAYAAGVIYIPCTSGVQALAYDQVARTFTPLWQGPADAVGPPVLSAGLVWSAATGGSKGGGELLYGLDPATGRPRYTISLPARIADHFASPSAAGGRLFMATGSSVTAYQLSAPPSPPPTVLTGVASSPTQTSATVGGSVNPNGSAVSDCHFEYGTSTAYGASVPCAALPGSGGEPVAVSAQLEGLLAGTTYHFRLSATGPGGTVTGADATFVTEGTPPPAPTVQTLAAANVTSTGAVLHGSVDPNGSAVSDCHFEYGTSAAYGTSVPCAALPGSGGEPVAVSASVEGLAPATTYHFRLLATGPGGTTRGQDATLTTASQPPPTVHTDEPSAVGGTTAIVNATVDPNGGAVSDCSFDYGTTAAYGAKVPCSPSPGSGSEPVAVSATLEGLAPGTAYHVRVEATNAGGTRFGEDATFTTAPGPPPPPPPAVPVPSAVTAPATSVTQTSAMLAGSVDPNGNAVSDCRFDYGPSTAYGASVPCAALPGSGGEPVAVSASVGGLAPATTYHFRLVAVGPGGAGSGGDLTFTTAAPAAPAGVGVLGASVASQAPALSVLPFATAARPAAPLARVASTLGIVDRAGRVILLVRCPGTVGACTESITLRTLHAVRAPGARSRHAHAHVLTLASGRFALAAGQIRSVTLRLDRGGRALLARVHPLRARATLEAIDAAGVRRRSLATLTLRLAFGGR